MFILGYEYRLWYVLLLIKLKGLNNRLNSWLKSKRMYVLILRWNHVSYQNHGLIVGMMTPFALVDIEEKDVGSQFMLLPLCVGEVSLVIF